MSDSISYGMKKCCVCGEIKRITDFVGSKREEEGKQYTCRKCADNPPRRVKEELPPGMKRCTKCKEIKPATLDFFKYQSKERGTLYPSCRVCATNYCRQYIPKDLGIPEDGIKTCCRCGEVKNIDQFPTRNYHGVIKILPGCKACFALACRLKKHKNPDLYRELNARYRERHREEIRERSIYHVIKYNFGITADQYRALVESQSGKCAICGCLPRDGKRLDIDHDHATGKVRGLLCNPCNTLLGNAHDNIEVLFVVCSITSPLRQIT